MLLPLIILLNVVVGVAPDPASDDSTAAAAPVAIAVHGGAGVILREHMTAEMEAEYRFELEAALRAGHEILVAGGSAMDAVAAAVRPLEDSPLFNAGRGAVLTSEGTAELDASIMDGETLNAGAVAGIKRVRNPILAARAVMENSPHVMMVGEGAETFVEPLGLEPVENDYFITDRRREQLRRARDQEAARGSLLAPETVDPRQLTGTVGAVALDARGNLAAATSTGGMTNKRFGRVGDSPIIGAGTYADNRSAAVSATGHGEFFIRLVLAHAISARMLYKGEDLLAAARAVIHGDLTDLGGTGGVIAIDAQGNITMPFNTPGMFRGAIDRDGEMTIAIYGD